MKQKKRKKGMKTKSKIEKERKRKKILNEESKLKKERNKERMNEWKKERSQWTKRLK